MWDVMTLKRDVDVSWRRLLLRVFLSMGAAQKALTATELQQVTAYKEADLIRKRSEAMAPKPAGPMGVTKLEIVCRTPLRPSKSMSSTLPVDQCTHLW